MDKFYSAKYDRAFKEVFLKEKNKGMLKELLEKILNTKIYKLELKPNEQLSSNIHISEKRLDALLDTDIGKINIEINSENKSYVHPRNMSYICNEYSSHTLVGQKYDEETMIMQINLTYGMNKNEKVLREYKIRDLDNKEFVSNLKIIEINMEYYLNLWYDFIKKGTNESLVEENQLLIMLGLNEEDLVKLSKSYKKVNEFMKEIYIVNESPEFKNYMTEEEDREKIHNSELYEARKEGIEHGIEQGIEQGRKESIKEIAINMINNNMTPDDISRITGLSIDEIKKIK